MYNEKATAKGKYFTAEKRKFLDEVVLTVEQEEIPPELIINWDQTGICFVSSSSWTMEEKGVKRVKVVGQSDIQLYLQEPCLLPANTTDLLQPMDLSVNKPAKSFIKDQFS